MISVIILYLVCKHWIIPTWISQFCDPSTVAASCGSWMNLHMHFLGWQSLKIIKCSQKPSIAKNPTWRFKIQFHLLPQRSIHCWRTLLQSLEACSFIWLDPNLSEIGRVHWLNQLVGGWTNPFEKYYYNQNGSFPPRVNNKDIFELPPPTYLQKSCGFLWWLCGSKCSCNVTFGGSLKVFMHLFLSYCPIKHTLRSQTFLEKKHQTCDHSGFFERHYPTNQTSSHSKMPQKKRCPALAWGDLVPVFCNTFGLPLSHQT